MTSATPVSTAVLMSVAQQGPNCMDSVFPRDLVDTSHPV